MTSLIWCVIGIVSISSMAKADSEANPNSVLVIDADKQFAFAEQYFTSKEYYRAIGEYERFIFFFPADNRVQQAMMRIAMCYYHGERFGDAISAFKKLIDRFPDSEVLTDAYLKISLCYTKLNQSASAIAILEKLAAEAAQKEIRDLVNYHIGWIYIENASWDAARVYFEKISEESHKRFRVKRIMTALEDVDSLKIKNPKTAGLLSIMPGAGYAYLGRFRDAFTAFFVNGGLIWAAITAFNEDNPALGGVVTFVATGFYGGNIFGAVSGAHKHNRMQIGRFIQQLKDNATINLFSDFKNHRYAVALRYAF